MKKKTRAYELWKQMKPGALRRLALAVFLVFGVIGPLTALMESELHLLSWGFIAVQTLACGGMAACIILFGRKRWWMTVIFVLFWSYVIVLNSGGLSFVVDGRGLRVEFSGLNQQSHTSPTSDVVTLTPAEFDAIYTQRGLIGLVAIALLASGYGMFISVIGKELQERARLETEVRIARDIQRSLMPVTATDLAWCSVAGVTLPATEVGGDYFDIVRLSQKELALVAADVTGHGVGAGILSAMTKSAFHLQLKHDPSPVRVLENLNRTLFDLSDEKTFVTFAYALLDDSSHSVRLATAGHPPVLHFQSRTKQVALHRTASLGLGIKAESRFSELTVACEPGDLLLLYTDGAIEAVNAMGEQFGVERLVSLLENSNGSSQQICSEVIKALQQFSGRESFEDDVTLVCVRLQ